MDEDGTCRGMWLGTWKTETLHRFVPIARSGNGGYGRSTSLHGGPYLHTAMAMLALRAGLPLRTWNSLNSTPIYGSAA